MTTTPLRFLHTTVFWTWFLPTLAIAGSFFAWELKLVMLPVWNLPRLPATNFELIYTAILTLLLALAAGLLGWQRRYGSCPAGVKRTAGVAGVLGGIALLCPVCLALPAAFLGIGTFFAIVGEYLPLIRLVAILFAMLAVGLLWPASATSSAGVPPRSSRSRSAAPKGNPPSRHSPSRPRMGTLGSTRHE